jgi:ABC-type antimicrobial peptide transport system permease subunit
MVAAFGLLRTVSSVIQLQTVSFLDAAAFAVSVTVVLGAAVLAAYQPARRATRIDPSQALRADG